MARPAPIAMIAGEMREAMRWLAVVAVGILAVAGIVVARSRRDHRASDVGALSDEWIAQHQVSAPEAF